MLHSKGPLRIHFICYRVHFVCVHVARDIKSEASSVSAEVLALWHRAVNANCRSAKTQLFNKWMESGKDFARWVHTNAQCVKYAYLAVINPFATGCT